MRTLPVNCADADIANLVIEWNELLAARKYTDAIEMLHPSDPAWDAEKLEQWITCYGTDEPIDDERCYVTTYHEAELPEDLSSHKLDIDRESLYGQDKEIYDGMVHYQLPLDGYWNDLTARFEIRKTGNEIALELLDVHVL